MSTIKLADCLNGHEPNLERQKHPNTKRITYQERCECTDGPTGYSIPAVENGWNTLIRKMVELAIPKGGK